MHVGTQALKVGAQACSDRRLLRDLLLSGGTWAIASSESSRSSVEKVGHTLQFKGKELMGKYVCFFVCATDHLQMKRIGFYGVRAEELLKEAHKSCKALQA